MNQHIILNPLARACNVPCAVVAAAFLCSVLASAASSKPVQAATCSGSLQAKIDAAPVGGTVRADACIYREQVRLTKPLTLVGQPGSEIRGSDVWTQWQGSISVKTLPTFPQEDVSCEKGLPNKCAWPEQVFVDGEPLEQVATDATPGVGEFKVNASRKVVLGQDSSGHTVEVTVRRHWITGTPAADNVTIEGFTMKHAATDWRCGGLQAHAPSDASSTCRSKGDGDGWTIRDNDLSYAHGAGISARGDGTLIAGNNIHHNGELGIHNPGDNSTVRSNEVSFNNTENFCIRPSTDYCVAVNTDGVPGIQGGSPLTESGGMKIAGGKNSLTIDRNHVHHNHGNGIWFDLGARNAQITNNVTHHNSRRGIFWEISYDAEIAYNTIYENGWGTPDGLNGSGLEVGTSDGANVHHNVIAWNAYNLLAKCSTGRDNPSCEGNWIHDNTLIGSSPRMLLGWTGQSSFFSTTTNRGESNDYWYSAPEPSTRFAWNGSISTLSAFNATRGEEGGQYLTSAEKDAALSSRGVPTEPER